MCTGSKLLILAALASVGFLSGCGGGAEAPNFDAGLPERVAAKAEAEGKYAIFWFHNEADLGSKQTARVLEEARNAWPARVVITRVNVRDEKHQDLVARFNVRRTPLTLVVAPNGAITAGFPYLADVEQLEKAFVPPTTAEILHAVQRDQTVFVCVGRAKDPRAGRNLSAAREAEELLEGIAKVVAVDPEDAAVEGFLRACKLDSAATEPVTLVVSPRGSLVARLEGSIAKQDLFDSFAKILQIPRGCGPADVTGGSTCQPGRGSAGAAGCD